MSGASLSLFLENTYNNWRDSSLYCQQQFLYISVVYGKWFMESRNLFVHMMIDRDGSDYQMTDHLDDFSAGTTGGNSWAVQIEAEEHVKITPNFDFFSTLTLGTCPPDLS